MYIESQKDPNSQCTLEGGKMNKAGDITLIDFKPYCKSIMIKIL